LPDGDNDLSMGDIIGIAANLADCDSASGKICASLGNSSGAIAILTAGMAVLRHWHGA
jgi:hypothetical protein